MVLREGGLTTTLDSYAEQQALIDRDVRRHPVLVKVQRGMGQETMSLVFGEGDYPADEAADLVTD